MASTDSSLLTGGCRLAYGTAEFKSTDVVLNRADGLFSAHEDFALWKVLISSPGKRSPVLGLVRQSHRRVTKISRCRNNSALTIDSPSLVPNIRMSPLASRAATQTAGFLILFALIFVSAGTIHFSQGWLFCVSFSFSTVGTGVYLMSRDPALLERRMRFGPRAESRPRQKIIVAVIFAMFAALLIVPGLDHRFGWSQVPAAIVALANLLIIAAFGFFLLVLRENTFAASTITVEAGQRLISSGPYAHVRHPMYAGAALLIFAMPIALGSLWGMLPAAFAIPVLIARILDEERTLSAELPGYDDYCRAVPYRLVPLVW